MPANTLQHRAEGAKLPYLKDFVFFVFLREPVAGRFDRIRNANWMAGGTGFK